KKLGKKSARKDVCWNGYIMEKPLTFPEYDAHVSLHRPFVDYWHDMGLKALELQPGIPADWSQKVSPSKNRDVLFYGQFLRNTFDARNELIEGLLKSDVARAGGVHCHLTYDEFRKHIFRMNWPFR